MVKVCPVCGKEFEAKRRNCSKCCCVECQDELYRRNQEKYRKKRKAKSKSGRPEDQIQPTQKNTLCWSCQNATGGCSWSKALKPVRGWKTKRRILKHNEKGEVTYSQSYKVESCPKYKKDEPRRS